VLLYREGLACTIAQTGRIAIIGTVDSGSSAVTRVAELAPDVVILDMGIPDPFGVARAVCAVSPQTKIIAFAIHDADHSVLECAEAGITGYVARDGSLDELISAVESAVRGELHCSPQVAASLFRRLATLTADREAPRIYALTGREREILALIERGCSNKEIGHQLTIGTATVKNHVHNILEKLQVRRRQEAAAHARGHAGRRAARVAHHPLEQRI
jgi:DNA-binding NarL/FixJ family response regulator